MPHDLDRALIHYAASAFLLLAVYFILGAWALHNKKAAVWIPAGGPPLLLISALLVWAITGIREPYDVSVGQTVAKAFSDIASWALGLGSAAWGLYRFYFKRGKT
jgi:hypothetical protein